MNSFHGNLDFSIHPASPGDKPAGPRIQPALVPTIILKQVTSSTDYMYMIISAFPITLTM